MLPEAHLGSLPGCQTLGEWPSWLSGSLWCFLFSSSVYSCHLFLISSVRSLPFLSFIVPIFAWNFPLVSPIFLRSLVFPIILFSSISLHCSLKKAFLSLLAVLWNSAFSWVYLSPSCLPFCFSSFLSYLEGLLKQPLCLVAFLFLGGGFDHHLLYSVTNLHP